ncbi:MAG: response regulator transcription factor [Halioglobus sp.]|nr:response regulator transcription factor [Halioglobus sp.]
MPQVFVTPQNTLRERWREAFPEAVAVAEVPHLSTVPSAEQYSVWLDLGAVPVAERLAQARAACACGYPVVAMVPLPREGEAFSLLSAGIQGYCHVEAASGQLQEIAQVVTRGGLWMPPTMLQRFLAVSTRSVAAVQLGMAEFDELTGREQMVAEQVALGASNREIAEKLEITERTVKAHLSAIFAKLGARDRVQLALKMNNIPTQHKKG